MSKTVGISNKNEVASEEVFDPKTVEARFKKWFPDLSAEIITRLVVYQSELLTVNKTINLVPSGTSRNMEALHFADSIYACRLIRPQLLKNAPIYDFGSGNGLPGLIFGILFPDIRVILVDRDSRKLEFCKSMASKLKLENITFQSGGIEDLPMQSVVNAVTRGAAPLQRALLIARKQVVKGGRLFHLKDDGWANELAQVPSQLFTFWSPSLLGQYKIPETSNEMAVVLTDKIAA